MTSTIHQRGAVHVLFLVLVLVLALVFAGLWFVQMQDNDKLRAAAEAARSARSAAEEQSFWYKGVYEEIAPLIGAEVPGQAAYTAGEGAPTAAVFMQRSKAAVQSILATTGGRVDDPSIRPNDLASLVEALVGRFAKVKAERDTHATTIRNKDTELAGLRNQISQADAAHVAERTRIQENADRDKRTLDAQIDSLTQESQANSARVRDLTDRGIKDREEFNSEVQALAREKTELDGQVRTIQAEKRVARATQVPDGKIVDVDTARSRVFLDIGSRDLLRRDQRFQVFGFDKGNERIHKGYVTVTDVMADMAEAYVDELVPGQRIERSDIVYSPIFDRPGKDPNRKVRFVFLGQLPGRYSFFTTGYLITNIIRFCFICYSICAKD